jgi:hypothetical protein
MARGRVNGFSWPEAWFLGRRMRSAGLLLAGVALAAFVTATAASAVTAFSRQILPLAAAGELARLPGGWLGAIGLVDGPTMASDTAIIRAQARGDLGAVPFSLDTAAWSAPLALTTAGGRTVTGAEVAGAPQIAATATLTAGHWPGAPAAGTAGAGTAGASGAGGSGAGGNAAGAGPVEVAVPVTVARHLALSTGSVLAVTNSNNGARLRIKVTGVYRQDNPTAPYWNLDAIWTCSARVQGCFTAGGPVVANLAAFGRSAALGVDQASWVMTPDAARIPPDELTATAGRIAATVSDLQNNQALGGLVVSGSIQQNLTSVAAELTASRTELIIIALLLLLPAAGALALAARLLAAYREEEHALLFARAATRGTLAAPALAEALLVGGAAAVAGTLAGPPVANLLAGSAGAGFSGAGFSGAGLLPLAAIDWWPAIAVAALCGVMLTWPVLRTAAPGAVRVRRGRQAALATAAVAGGDVALLTLAAVAAWQLYGYTPTAGTAVDPVVVAAPTLALAAVSLVPLRLQPLLARVLDRAAAATPNVTSALAAWEIARQPVRRSAPVLLAVLAVATTTLAFASYASWQRSAQDQAAFTTGADIRVDAPAPFTPAEVAALGRAPGVTAAMTAALVPLSSGTLLALDAPIAARAVLLRPDLSPVPETTLFGLLAPTGPSRSGGTGSAETGSGGTVPGVATAAFLAANNLAVGDTYPLTIATRTVPVKIAAVVSAFPELPAAGGGGIVADLTAVNRVLGAGGRLPVTSVWLRTGAGSAAADRLPVPAGSVVTSRTEVVTGLLGDSLSAAPQRAAFGVAVAVAVLAALGFSIAVAATLRERRGRRLLLKALGVPLRSQAWQLCGEELLLTVPAAVVGLLAGVGLAHLIIAAVVLTPGGTVPMPPVAVVVPLGWAVAAGAAICALPPVVALAAGARRRYDAAAALRGAEAT